MPEPPGITGGRPLGGIRGDAREQGSQAADGAPKSGRLEQYSLAQRRSTVSPRELARRFQPSFGTGRSNGTWLRVRAEVLKENPALKAAERQLRSADRQDGTHKLQELWKDVSREFSQQLPETLRLMSDGRDAKLLGARASTIAKDVLSNILRQRLPAASASAGGPSQSEERLQPSARNQPRRPPPQAPPPPVPGKSVSSGNERLSRPPRKMSKTPDRRLAGSSGNELQQRELGGRQDRLGELLEQRAQLQQKARDAQKAMRAPFRKLHQATRERAQAFLPGGRHFKHIMARAKVPASIRSSPEFGKAFERRLNARLERRFQSEPTRLIPGRKLQTIAALAAREANQDVQAEHDLKSLSEV